MEEKQLVNLIKKLFTLVPIDFRKCGTIREVTYYSKNYDRYYTIEVSDYTEDDKLVSLTIKKELYGVYLSIMYIKNERSKNEIAYAVSDIVDQLEATEAQFLEKFIAEQEYKGMDSLLPDNAE